MHSTFWYVTTSSLPNNIQKQKVLKDHNLEINNFLLITIHRPATVDNKEGLVQLCGLLHQLGESNTIVFPMHPRTLKNINKFGLKAKFEAIKSLIIIGPLDYYSFQNLIHNCKIVITDSGGIQEEPRLSKSHA